MVVLVGTCGRNDTLRECVRRAALTSLAVLLIGSVTLEAAAQPASITVDAATVENHVSPRMYAAFVEMMAEDVKWGMTAEMIHDRSFEEAPNYMGLPARWQLEPDERNDTVAAIQFTQATDEAYPKLNTADHSAEHALRVKLNPQDITDTRRGLSQGRLSIVAHTKYEEYLWMKTPVKDGYVGDISATLEEDETDGETYARTTLAPVDGDWRQYRFELEPAKTDRFARLTFLFGGKGTVYLDQVSLEPAIVSVFRNPSCFTRPCLVRPTPRLVHSFAGLRVPIARLLEGPLSGVVVFTFGSARGRTQFSPNPAYSFRLGLVSPRLSFRWRSV